jgi:hypothetical protein
MIVARRQPGAVRSGRAPGHDQGSGRRAAHGRGGPGSARPARGQAGGQASAPGGSRTAREDGRCGFRGPPEPFRQLVRRTCSACRKCDATSARRMAAWSPPVSASHSVPVSGSSSRHPARRPAPRVRGSRDRAGGGRWPRSRGNVVLAAIQPARLVGLRAAWLPRCRILAGMGFGCVMGIHAEKARSSACRRPE